MRTPLYSDHQIIEAGKALRRKYPDRVVTPNAIRTRMGGGNTTRIRDVWDRYCAKFALATTASKKPADVSLSSAEAEQALDSTLEVVSGQLRDVILALAAALDQGRLVGAAPPSDTDGQGELIASMAARITAQDAEIRRLRQALAACEDGGG